MFFTDATGGCYHTTGDDSRFVNFRKVEAQSLGAFRLTLELAETKTRPSFVPPNPSLVVYDDAVALDAVFTTAVANLGIFPSADQVVLQGIQQQVAKIVADGASAFDLEDIAATLVASIQAIDVLTRLGCQGFK